jgi:hypothetical protein
MWPRWVLLAFMVTAAAPDGRPAPVATRMRHLLLHLGHGVDLRVDDLSGRLVSRTAGPPVFDDVRSYLVELDAARVGMTPESLTNLMNNYVFARADAPISKLHITVENGELKQTGHLRKGIEVPFTMRGSIAATPDGKIRIHPTSLKAAGFLSKRVLDFFGLELERLVKTGTPAVTVDGDDLLLDPEQLLPPPAIRGRLTKVWIENGVVMQQFASASPHAPIAPPDRRFTNYMYYRGGTLRFGKLTMQDTDLLLVDADPKDPFDFSPEGYERQLVAGYSKNTPAHGLIVYMPDFNDLGRGMGAPRHQRADGKPRERQHHQ